MGQSWQPEPGWVPIDPTEARIPPASAGRLMVVDDDGEFVFALTKALTENNFEAIGFTSGYAALEALKYEDFDVVLAGLVMPELSGIDLLRAAKDLDPHIVGIVMTSQRTVESAIDAIQVGAFDYVVKPITIGTLLPVLTRALEVRLLRKENFQLRESVAIYDLSNAVAFTLDLNTILNKVADTALHQALADEVSIMLPTQEGDALFVAVARGANRDSILGQRVALDQGVAGWVARHHELLVLNGEVNDSRFTPIRPRSDIRAAVSLPMLVAGGLVGVLNVNATRPRSFSMGQIKALTVLANIAAAMIKTASLYTQAREAEEKYRSIFENAVEGVYQVTPEGRYISANPALAQMLGYTTARDLMRSIVDISQQVYVVRGRYAELVRQLDENNAVHGFESQVYRKDGSVIWISENARAVLNNNCEVLYYEGMVEDITERKRSEVDRELADQAQRESNRRLEGALSTVREMQQQIVQQERLRALGQMASGIAHDFNNDLAMIVGFSELLLKRPDDLKNVDKARSYLQMIRTVAGDAANVVDRLREFFRQRQEGEEFLPLDLNQLAEQAILLTQPKWKYQAQANGTTIRVELELENVPLISGNASDLREALTNLILNAVDAMPTGGQLTIRTQVVGERVRLDVSDTGVGMTEEIRQRCLEPFFTTKGERGTGLGLSMVYGIVKRHDGTVDIHTAPGQGTTFSIALPIDRNENPDERPGPVDEVTTSPRRVLVVEDEAPLRRILTEYLAFDGHAVETAVNGRDGVEKFLSSELAGSPDQRFDLVVTDLAMPEMSGDQLALAIKRTAPSTPIILLTGFGEMIQSSGHRPSGVDLVIPKPVSLVALQQAVAKVIA